MVNCRSICSTAASWGAWGIGAVAKGSLKVAKGSYKVAKGSIKLGLLTISKCGGYDLTVGAGKQLFAKEKEIEITDRHSCTKTIKVPTTWSDNLTSASGKVVTGVLKASAATVVLTGTGCEAIKYATNQPSREFGSPICQGSQAIMNWLYVGTRDTALPQLLVAKDWAVENGSIAIKHTAQFVSEHKVGSAVAIPTVMLTGASLWKMKNAYDNCAEAWESNSLWSKITGYGAGVINLGLAGVAGTAAVALNVYVGTMNDPRLLFKS